MEMVSVEVICFAGLRKYFGSGTTVRVGAGAPYSDAIDEISGADLKIAILHHPFKWLSEFDQNRIVQLN